MSKWFAHIISNDAEPSFWEHLDWYGGIKLVGDDNVHKRVTWLKTRYPGKPIVVRFANREDGNRPKTPADAIAFLAAYSQEYGMRDVWFQTFRCMPAMNTETAAWDADMIRLARPLGIRLIVGDFSMGYPGVGRFSQADNPDLWKTYYPVFEQMVISGAANVKLGMQLYVGNGDLVMGEGWLSLPLRYRELYRVHLLPNGWGGIEVFGTEGGFDAGNMKVEHISPQVAAKTMLSVEGEWFKDGRRLWGAVAYTLDKSEWAENGFDQRPVHPLLVSAPSLPDLPPTTTSPPVVVPEYRKYRVVAPYGMNIRRTPNTQFAPVGFLPKRFVVWARPVDENWVVTDSGFNLARLFGGVALLQQED